MLGILVIIEASYKGTKLLDPKDAIKKNLSCFPYKQIAVWIDEILLESNDRMLMMDFDEDEGKISLRRSY